jgi:predicted short-subunit dehydrogenase-like oxidoreductase (DUF2520 family)
MANRKKSESISLVGAGNLAHALARLLPARGWQIAEIVTRSSSSRARALGREVRANATTMARAKWAGGIVWLAVSDGAIGELGSALAAVTNWKGKIVIHSSGALSSHALLPLRRRGAHVASVHPMMTFVLGETPEMAEVVWTVEGDPVAVNAARRIVHAMGGEALSIDRRHKPMYHAFGAFLSPLLVVHLVTASRLAAKAGIPKKHLRAVMKPIVERTVRNLFSTLDEKGGAGKALSGPLIRGDLETTRAHLESLRSAPAARRLYAALLAAALDTDLPIKNRTAIAKLLAKKNIIQ